MNIYASLQCSAVSSQSWLNKACVSGSSRPLPCSESRWEDSGYRPDGWVITATYWQLPHQGKATSRVWRNLGTGFLCCSLREGHPSNEDPVMCVVFLPREAHWRPSTWGPLHGTRQHCRLPGEQVLRLGYLVYTVQAQGACYQPVIREWWEHSRNRAPEWQPRATLYVVVCHRKLKR